MWEFLRRLIRGRRRADSLGSAGEEQAAAYLRQLGWRILARNYRHRLGELDLIAQDGDTVVFVEVKTRSGASHGLPLEAVHLDKQRRITRIALAYLKQRGWLERRSRFDVISIVLSGGDQPPQLSHYRHAFEAHGRGQMYS
ncbi:YraN family protein [bacterium]|nr:YraN family protein [bacterium]